MHEHITSFKQNPTQKFSKTQKPRLKCVKCIRKERKWDHTRGKKQGSGQNPNGEDEWVEGKVFGREKEGFCWKRSKKSKFDFALDLFLENAFRWIEICRALILDKWICQGAIENLSTAKYLDGLRSYREFIE